MDAGGRRLAALVVLLSMVTISFGSNLFKLQAEGFKTEGKIIKNDNAFGKRAVRLGIGQKHKMFFCLQRKTKVSLQNIRYFNTGGPKALAVRIDSMYMDVVNNTDQPSCEKRRNMYITEKSIGKVVTLSRGRHIIRLQVTISDMDGLDLDMVALDIRDLDLSWDAFMCRSFCNSEIPFGPSADLAVKDTTGPAKAVQQSYSTKCAEADNVKILFYHEHVKRYKIRARHPIYRTLENQRKPNFKSCAFSTNLLWKVDNIHLTRTANYVKKDVKIETNIKTYFEVEMVVTFQLQGREKGFNDHDVGNTLSLTMTDIVSLLVVYVNVLDRDGYWKKIDEVIINKTTTNLQWTIPDYTWTEAKKNKLKLVFTGQDAFKAKVVHAKLEKRPLNKDKSFSIFNDANIIVEGVHIDMWWLQDGIMVTVEGEKRIWHCHYFRFYFPVPWSDGFSQVFVMYQDGNVRLLPYTPHGADWIPFGSSVTVGQVNASHLRPAAEIKRVHINPDDQDVTVFYKDGGAARIMLDVNMDETTANVQVIRLGRNPVQFPFVSFRSMWVKDGNCDVDHVSANGVHSRHILDEWKVLYGYAFTFYRQCISKHNTQSPDINIEIMD